MTRILAIDPGSARSAWLLLENGRPAGFDIAGNDHLLTMLRNWPHAAPSVVVIEQIESYGMAVGREVFETVHWSGRFDEAVRVHGGILPIQLPRRAVKLAICGNSRARDANIRQALIDRFGGVAAVGRKAEPGPLYGISKDVWSALAIAVTYAETYGSAAA